MTGVEADFRIGPTEPHREDKSELAQAWLRGLKLFARVRRREEERPYLQLVRSEPRADNT